MKTRKSLEGTESKFKNKMVNNNKTKLKSHEKANQSLNGSSYRDTHNIGRRKSNDSVITYSLNSHLFFDIYAKFDQNNVPKLNGVSKTSRKPKPNSLESSPLGNNVVISSDSGDTSTEAMSANECNSNKSSPRLLKIICEAQPVNKDEVFIPSPKMEEASPFKPPCMPRISPKKTTLPTKDLETKLETFHNILDNKSVFKKLRSVKKTNTKLKSLPKIARRMSERISKAVKSAESIDEGDNGVMNFKSILPNKKGLRKQKLKCENDLSPAAVAILNCDHVSSVNDIEESVKLEDNYSDGYIKLEVEISKLADVHEIIVIEAKEMHEQSKVLKFEDISRLKEENDEDSKNKCSKMIDKELIIGDESTRLDERRKDVRDTLVSAGLVSKKGTKKPTSCFFDIMATGSQRECERNNVKSLNINDSHNRNKESGDNRDSFKAFKNNPTIKKTISVIKKEEETKKDHVVQEEDADTLWLWHGDSQEKSIQLQLDGEIVTRMCYPAIKHAKDDVVIKVMDCVMLRSADKEPYVAMITAFFLDEESGKKMIAVLWYYRPEQTDQGLLPWQTDTDVYASKHMDTNSVDCIEDKAFVLPIELYARFMSYQKRQSSTSRQGLCARMVPTIADDFVTLPLSESDEPKILAFEPSMDMFASTFYYGPNYQTSFPSEMTSSNVFCCRGIYDIKQHKVSATILPWIQSPVHEPLERCLSVDSAMSISSGDSDSRLDLYPHLFDRCSPSCLLPPPPPPPSPPPSSSSHQYRHSDLSFSANSLLPSIDSLASRKPLNAVSKCLALSTSIPATCDTVAAVLAVNGSRGSYQHNGHY